MSASEWLTRHFDLAAEKSSDLRERYGLVRAEGDPPNQRWGTVRWSSETAFIEFFADVWERYETVRVGTRTGDRDTLPYDDSLTVGLTCVALGLEPRSVLVRPSRHDRDNGLPEWLTRETHLAASHLGPVLAGDRDFEAHASSALAAHVRRPLFKLFGR